MKCGSCGGFYNQQCQRWPQCQPAEPDPLRRVRVTPYRAAPYDALLHCFSTDYEELNTGAVPFPSAVIEHASGAVESVHVNLISFIEPTKGGAA